jgi:hypothetical protein
MQDIDTLNGNRPKLEWVPVKALMIDERYQRDMVSRASNKLIKSIADAFDWSKFQTLTLTDNEDGTYNVIDGQHRAAAARAIAITDVPCLIVETERLSDEAQSFVSINRDRVRPNSIQLHHAERTAHDATALLIDEVCKKAGVTIPRTIVNNDLLKPGETLAVRTINRLIKDVGADTVAEGLSILHQAWPDVGGELTAPMIKGVCNLIGLDRAHPDGRLIDIDRLVSVIRERDAESRREAARAFAKQLSIQTAVALRMQLVIDYNKRLRTEKRLPWDR